MISEDKVTICGHVHFYFVDKLKKYLLCTNESVILGRIEYTYNNNDMSEFAEIKLGDKTYQFPVVTGSENEKAIDISKLRDETGYVTLDTGYKNTGATKSAITFLDGEEGILRYRGYSIEDLAEKADFLEVSYLLIFGELPTKAQLEQFENDIRKYTLVHEEMKDIIDGFPASAHPMGILTALTSALTAFNPKPVDVKSEHDMYHAVCKTLGKFVVLCSWVYRTKVGYPLNYYDNSKGYVENFMRLMFAIPTTEYKANKVVVDALDKLLILHADHDVLNHIEFHPHLVESDRAIKLFMDQMNHMDYFPKNGKVMS